jgi:hypothetical protein
MSHSERFGLLAPRSKKFAPILDGLLPIGIVDV